MKQEIENESHRNTRTARLHMVIPESLKREMQNAANQEGMTMSRFIIDAITRRLENLRRENDN